MSSREKAPVFVVGSARSGNTMLYHMLLSSGHFPIYRTEPVVFDLLIPLFGDLRSAAVRRKLMRFWLRSRQFRRSGLDARQSPVHSRHQTADSRSALHSYGARWTRRRPGFGPEEVHSSLPLGPELPLVCFRAALDVEGADWPALRAGPRSGLHRSPLRGSRAPSSGNAGENRHVHRSDSRLREDSEDRRGPPPKYVFSRRAGGPQLFAGRPLEELAFGRPDRSAGRLD